MGGVDKNASNRDRPCSRLVPDEGGENLRFLDTFAQIRLAVPITDAESSGRRERVKPYSEHIVLAVGIQVS